MASRRRLDTELVRRGNATSRSQAQSLIDEGRVRVSGSIADKPSRLVAPDEPLEIIGPPSQYVGRGAEKLLAAFDRWPELVEITNGSQAVDCGASTGGFTDCLLQHGARHVVAIDVGRNQLHERLRRDPRVTSREQTDIRGVVTDEVGGPFDLLVADLSFISLRSVVTALVGLCKPSVPMVLLVKPQFEAGRRAASVGRGVIRDDGVRAEALSSVVDAYTGVGCTISDSIDSPVHGAQGNREYLLLLRSPERMGERC